MAHYIFHIKDEGVPAFVAAMCAEYGYKAEIWNEDGTEVIPNSEKPGEFSQRMVGEYLKSIVVKHRGKKRANEVQAEVATEVDGFEMTIEAK